MKDRTWNDLTEEEADRVLKFLKGLGPYQADVWSNSYPGEILDFLNERKSNMSKYSHSKKARKSRRWLVNVGDGGRLSKENNNVNDKPSR